MQLQKLPRDIYSREDDAIDPRQLWLAVRQSWRSILGLCVVVSLLAILWVMRIDPVYRASTTIMIESQEAKTVSIEEVYGLPSGMREYFLTQFEIIKNRDIASRVADELNLWDDPRFAPPRTGADESHVSLNPAGWVSSWFSTTKNSAYSEVAAQEQRKAAVIDSIMSRLIVEPIEFTQLVVVSFESTDRELAARVVNTLAQVYIQSQMDAKLQSTREAGNWLTSKLVDLKGNLDASQRALQEFRDKENILDMSGGQTQDAQELNELTTRLGEARRARVGAENIYRELGGSGNYSVERLMSMPAVLQHPLVQHLAQAHTEAQQEVTNLGRRYGPEHPKMIQARARVESVKAELNQQVRQVASGIEKEYKVAQANEQNLVQQMSASKESVASLNRKEFRLQELEQQVETDKRLYEMFFNRARETSETIGFQAAHARVVEKATPPVAPVRPNKKGIVLIAFLLSGLVGVGLALLRHLLDNTIKSSDDVVEQLGAPLLGVVPDTKQPKGKAGPYTGYLDDTKTNFAEAVRNIRTGLVLTGLEKPHKITVITSTIPGEGKSTVAINLSAALAQMERVLLIDGDLRRPSVAMAFALPVGTPGLSNVLAHTDALEDCIKTLPAGFDVLPAGILPAHPQEMLSSQQFKKLVKQLSEQYDRIIIDSAPVNAVSDSLILATLADSLVYVIMADVTPRKLVLKNLDLIRYSNLPLTGVVLNRLDIKKQAHYGAGGYYSNTYGSEQA